MKDWLKTFAALVVAGMLCWVLWDAHLFLRDARTTLTLADPVLGNLNSTAQGLAEATVKFNALADTESGKIAASTEELRKTERATRASIDSLRQVFIDVHQTVIPQVTATIGHVDASQAQVTAATLGTIEGLKPSIEHMAQASQAAADALADPNIKKIVANLGDASQNSAEATKHLAAVTADAEKTADYYEKRLTTPQSFAKTLLQAVLQLGSQARILFAGN